MLPQHLDAARPGRQPLQAGRIGPRLHHVPALVGQAEHRGIALHHMAFADHQPRLGPVELALRGTVFVHRLTSSLPG